jgi:hypothetical protein
MVLNVPSDVYYVLFGTGQLSYFPAINALFRSSVNLAIYTNNSINFLMYFASGRKFRAAAADMMTCRWCRGVPRPAGGKPEVNG